MTNDVGNCVSLAGTRRTLYDNAVIALQLLDDRHLLIVVWHREVELKGSRWAVAGGKAPKRLLRSHAYGRVTALNEAANDTRQARCRLDVFLQTPNVFEKNVTRALTRKQDPSVGYLELVTWRRRRDVIGTHLIGTRRVQMADGRLQYAVERRVFERVDAVSAGSQRTFPECLQLPNPRQLHLGVAIRLQSRLDVTRPNFQVKGLLVERNLARLYYERMLHCRSYSFPLPGCVSNAPDEFKWGFGAFGGDDLL